MISDDQLIRHPMSSSVDIPLDPVLTQGLVKSVIERIIQILGADTIRPEQRLPSEKELMTAFSVGRSSIREALCSLVAMNLLETRPGKGYFVSPMAPSLIRAGIMKPGRQRPADFSEVMETRKILELSIAQLALARATEKDFQQVRHAGEDLVKAAAGNSALLPYTMRVHLAIASAAHNSFLKSLFTDLLPWIMEKFTPVQVPAKVDVQMHIQLMQGFVQRNVEQVLTAIEDHHHFWRMRFAEQYADEDMREERKRR